MPQPPPCARCDYASSAIPRRSSRETFPTSSGWSRLMWASAFATSSSSVSPRTTWPHSQLISFAIVSPSVGQDAIVLERELDEPRGHCRLRLPVGLEAARLAGHAGHVELRAAGHQRVVRVPETSGPEPDEIVENRIA